MVSVFYLGERFRFSDDWTEFSVDWEATEDFFPEDTDSARDFEQNEFLDLRRPLLRQVWESNFRCLQFLCLLFHDG